MNTGFFKKLLLGLMLTFASFEAAYGDVLIATNNPAEVVMYGSRYAFFLTIPLFFILMLLPWRQTPKAIFMRTFICMWLFCISLVALCTAGAWVSELRLAPVFLPLVLLFALLIRWKRKSLVPGEELLLYLLYIWLACVIIAWIVFSAGQSSGRDGWSHLG